MRVLLDTHILIWSADGATRLSAAARRVIADPNTTPVFSVASLWEIAIKSGFGRGGFRIDALLLRRGAIENGYEESPVLGAHAVAVAGLPPIHKDPFDRILLAQATVEGMTLPTADRTLARYAGPVRAV